MNNATWIDTFIAEKELDRDHEYTVEGDSGTNWIPLACVVETIKTCGAAEFNQIKTTLVKIDFLDGDVHHFFNHLAGAMAR